MADLLRAFPERLSSLGVVPGDRVLVAFSGGKDSTALLSLLDRFKGDLGLELVACHVHHGIRRDQADRDEAFCRAFAKERGIPFTARRADVPTFCKEKGLGLEEGARRERYRLLREAAKETRCRLIATAHTADDEAETVLFRLARGAGFHGAAGIPQRSGDLIRPLLPYTTEEILAYLKENGLPFVTDESNRDLAFARNRIRHKVLPELEQAVPGSRASLVRFAQTASEQNKLVQKCADRWALETKNDPSTWSVSFSDVASLARDEADRPVLYEIAKRMTGTEDIAISRERFHALLSLLKGGGKGRIIEIEKDRSFFCKGDRLVFGATPKDASSPLFCRVLSVGENALPEIGATLTRSAPERGKARNIHKNLLIIQAASDRIKGDLFAREWRAGDRVQMNGMSKSVGKALGEIGVGPEARHRLPVICDEDGIFWVPYLGLCDRARDPEASFVFTMRLTYDDTITE